jgi:hypothetical protein
MPEKMESTEISPLYMGSIPIPGLQEQTLKARARRLPLLFGHTL